MNPKEAMSVVKVDKLNELADEVNEIMKEVIKEVEGRFS